MEQHERMSKDEFASMLAHSLEERPQLLKILSMNHYDMETGNRPEHLTAFKVVYGESIRGSICWMCCVGNLFISGTISVPGLNRFSDTGSEKDGMTPVYV